MSWKSVGASVIGSSHIKVSKPCQDSHGIQSIDENILLLAVADGLGSAEHSEIGSRLAVDTALTTLAASLAGDSIHIERCHNALQEAFSSAREVLEERALTESMDIRDLGTTLICIVLSPECVACGQIGDGAVVIQQEDESLLLLSSPQRGEYANETVPLTTNNALEKVRYTAEPLKVKALAAISDGLQNLALQGTDYVPHLQFFMPFFNLLHNSSNLEETQKKIEEFLASERVLNRTDDDKTLVIAVLDQSDEIDTLQIQIE